MKVSELIQRLQQSDPSAVVLAWVVDPKDPNREGYFPITEVDVSDGAFSEEDGSWILGGYDPDNAVPAVWLD